MRSSLDPSHPSDIATYDERLVRRFLDGDDELNVAMTLCEQHSPATFDEAVALVAPPGQLTALQVCKLSKAWDLYWQLKDRPES